MTDSPFNISHRCGTCYATWYACRKAKALAKKYGFDGDDLLQELLMHILRQWPLRTSSRGKPSTFIQNVIDTKVCELIRKQRAPKRDFRCQRSLSDWKVRRAAEYGLLDGVRGQPAVSDHELVDLRSDCAEIIARLPAELRPIAELLKTMCPGEIARKLDLPDSTVRKRIADLREHFIAAGYGAA